MKKWLHYLCAHLKLIIIHFENFFFLSICIVFYRMQLIKMGPCGGDGGSPRDMDTRGVTRIAKIAVRSGHTIDAVSILYERNGIPEWSSLWGGRGGSFNEVCNK